MKRSDKCHHKDIILISQKTQDLYNIFSICNILGTYFGVIRKRRREGVRWDFVQRRQSALWSFAITENNSSSNIELGIFA